MSNNDINDVWVNIEKSVNNLTKEACTATKILLADSEAICKYSDKMFLTRVCPSALICMIAPLALRRMGVRAKYRRLIGNSAAIVACYYTYQAAYHDWYGRHTKWWMGKFETAELKAKALQTYFVRSFENRRNDKADMRALNNYDKCLRTLVHEINLLYRLNNNVRKTWVVPHENLRKRVSNVLQGQTNDEPLE